MTATHLAWLHEEPFDGEHHDWFVYHDLERDDPAALQLDTLDPPRRVPFLESAVTGRRLWGMYGEEIVTEHVAEHPGSRPLRWWQFDAPEMRQRLGGVGTPSHERLNDVPRFHYGVPVYWITETTVRTYRLIGSPLEVPALDLDDPPMYESEATYLDRLGLMLPGERRRLTDEDFAPESVLDLIDFDGDQD